MRQHEIRKLWNASILSFFVLYFWTEAEAESLPVCNGQSGTSLFNHSKEEAGSGETCLDQLNGVASKEPPLLREVDAELLQSGKLKLTGKFVSFCQSLHRLGGGEFCSGQSIMETSVLNTVIPDRSGEHKLTNVSLSFFVCWMNAYPVAHRNSGQVGTCSDRHRDRRTRGEFLWGGGGPGLGLLPQDHSVGLADLTVHSDNLCTLKCSQSAYALLILNKPMSVFLY